jgi:ketosteroid isomerase-like protein
MSQENVEAVRVSFDLYNRRDLATIQSGVTEDAELFTFTEGRAEGRPFVGPVGVREWLESDAEAWEQITVEADDLRDLGNRVLAIGRIKGRGRGSGLELDSPGAWIFEFRGRQVSYMRGYLDLAEAFEAAGLSE